MSTKLNKLLRDITVSDLLLGIIMAGFMVAIIIPSYEDKELSIYSDTHLILTEVGILTTAIYFQNRNPVIGLTLFGLALSLFFANRDFEGNGWTYTSTVLAVIMIASILSILI